MSNSYHVFDPGPFRNIEEEYHLCSAAFSPLIVSELWVFDDYGSKLPAKTGRSTPRESSRDGKPQVRFSRWLL